MNPGIFLIQDNEELVEMNEQAYDSEKPAAKLVCQVSRSLSGQPDRLLFMKFLSPFDLGGRFRKCGVSHESIWILGLFRASCLRSFQISFYSDPIAAVFKVLGVE
jgi:hypothetical protein